MSKTKKLKLVLAALLMAIFMCCTGVALGELVHASADEITVTIYNKGGGEIYNTETQRSSEWRYRSGFGTVTYNDQTISSQEATEKTITAQVSEAGLTVKAEAKDGSLFYCWATDEKAENVVSMKAEDTFTYEEVQAFGQAGLYAFFVPELSEDVRANMQFKITYIERLGDVYLFLKKENVDNETAQKHGLLIPSGQLIDIPFVQREVWSTEEEPATLSSTAREVNNITFAAIPKSEIDSTIDLSRSTSAVFKNWAATYSATNQSGMPALDEAYRPLPDICDTSQNTSSTNPEDGSIDYIPNQRTPVDETWVIPSLSVDRSSIKPEPVYSSSNSNWLINPFDNKYTYGNTISVQLQTIVAEFQEVAIVPDVEVTPIVNDETQEPITFDSESTEHVTFYYGQRNSINAIFVTSEQLVKQPDYQVTQTSLDVATGKYTSKTIPVTEVINAVWGFNIPNIDSGCTITITPDYGEEYFINSFVITIDLATQNGFNDLVSKESEAVTVVDSDDWYFNSGLTSNGVYTFTSGISYLTDLSKKSDSQLHFQVKGSGVFTFEFYLDGAGMAPYMPAAYAVYGTGAPINKSGISSGNFGNNTVALAQGNTQIGSLTDITYYPCKILATDKVTRIDEVNDWCRASIVVTAEGDDTATDIYIAFVSSPYNSSYGTIFGPHTVMSVRNVAYYQGHSNVSWGIYDNAEGDKTTWGTISAKSGGKDAIPADLSSGTMIDFSVEYDDATYRFYGWSDGAELLSTEKEFSYTVKGKTDGTSTTKISAVLAPINDPYSYRAGGEFYDKDGLETALKKAAEFRTNVYVLQSVEITKSVTIPANVNLVIPFDETNRLHGSAAEGDNVQEKISWLVDGDTFKYITVTIGDKATVTVNGGLYLGGVVNHPSQTYQGHTSGAYSEIVNNGTIVIGNGGIMDIYGHVTGTGTITVNYGGKLYEPFLILDYAGGTNTLGIFAAGQTPFKRYAMINIECPMTIHYGGMLYGHATLYALSAFFSLDQPFVSYDMGADRGGDGFGHDTIIMLNDGASVTITYNSQKVVHSNVATNCTEGIGQTKLEFNGGAVFSYMLFSAMGLEIPTNSVYFAIPYNFEVEMNGQDAKYETKTDFMIMPGAVVKVGKGATLTLNANAWVFDGMVQGVLDGKSYPTSDELKTAGYSKSGNLIVDGTLIIGEKTTVEGFDIGSLLGGGKGDSFDSKKIPATFLGVIQTNGTGMITIPANTVLKGKIIDGIVGRTYFEDETTARVWDKAHNCFGDLVAGHTYTATSGEGFTLAELKYTNTDGGEETGTLALNSSMFGSWKLDHETHTYDWTELSEDEKPTATDMHKTATRYCQELGCNEADHREILFVPENWGYVDYKGSAFTKDELMELINKLFGKDGEGYDLFDKAGGSLEFTSFTDHNDLGYDVKVTLSSGYWYNGTFTHQTELTLRFYVDKAEISSAEIKDLDLKDETYTGSAITKNFTVKLGEYTLQAGTDYQVSYSANTNVGEVTITITGMGNNFTGAVTKTFQIVARDIGEPTVVWSSGEKTYTGSQITPNVTSVTVNGRGLTAETDYKIEYGANKNVGEGTVTITGQGNYTGSIELKFNITQKDVKNEAKATVENEYTYNGEKQNVDVKVTLAGFTLTEGDYEIAFAKGDETEVKNAGTYTVTVTFQGNFTGKATTTFEVKQKSIVGLTFSGVEGSYGYTGKQIEVNPVVKDGETTLEAEKDYTFTYSGERTNVSGSPVTVTITGSGNYTGTKELTFTITPKDANGANVAVDGTYTYNSKEQEVKVSVTLEGFGPFAEGKDYSISYEGDHTNAGTVNFTVNFTGNYSESKSGLTFEIEKAKVTVTPNNAESPEGEAQTELSYQISGTMYGDDQTTLKSGLTLKIEGGVDITTKKAGETCNIVAELSEEAKAKLNNYDIDLTAKGTYTITAAVFKDVEVADNRSVVYDGQPHGIKATGLPEGAKDSYVYSVKDGEPLQGEPTDAGVYTVEVTITLEPYKPYKVTRTLTISKKEITVTLTAQTVTYNGQAQSVQSGEGFYTLEKDAIVEGDEVAFTLSSATLTDVGSTDITLTVDGKDAHNYKVTQNSAKFTVEALPLAEGSVKVTSKHTYNGQAQTPTLEVTVNDLPVPAGDYDVSYSQDRTNAGEVTVTVTMKENKNFSGSANTTFTIGKASITGATVTGSYTYNGEEQTPTLTVKADTLTLDEGDYTVTIEGDHTNVGKVTVKIEAAEESNYQGSATATFEITAARIDSFTIATREFTYDGTEHALDMTVKAGELILTENDYTVDYNGKGLVEAGQVTVTVTGHDNFTGTQSLVVTIEAATLTEVTVSGTYTYNGTAKSPEIVVKAGTLTPNGDDYNVTFSGNLTNAGTVEVTVTGKGNYQGTVNTSFTIAKATISVTLSDRTSVYGEPFEQLTFTYEGVIEQDKSGVIVSDYLDITSAALTEKNAGDYDITATFVNAEKLANYAIVIVENGTYTITAREVTVVIEDQTDIYNYLHEYSFDGAKWHVKEGEGDGLAEGEGKNVLGVTLAEPEMTNAGEYEIAGDWSGKQNYSVTFEGTKGTKGTFKVEKQDISGDDGIFVLLIEGRDDVTTEGRTIYVKYAGEDLVLTGHAAVFEDDPQNPKTLEATVDHATLTAIGDYEVTLTVNDPNYSGTAVFAVHVTNADGYTQHLTDTLGKLEKLAEGLDINALKAEDYANLVQIYELLNDLSDEENEVGAEALAGYWDLVDAWNSIADIDKTIETAEKIANAPIEGLFAAVAALTSIAMAAYIIGKGGIL